MKQIQQLANDLHTLFFLKFVFLEQECNLGGMITGHIGIKNSNIKKCTQSSVQASSTRTAEFGVKDSLLSGCRGPQQLHHDKISATRKQ